MARFSDVILVSAECRDTACKVEMTCVKTSRVAVERAGSSIVRMLREQMSYDKIDDRKRRNSRLGGGTLSDQVVLVLADERGAHMRQQARHNLRWEKGIHTRDSRPWDLWLILYRQVEDIHHHRPQV